MMTSLVLLVPIVVSVTAAPMQQILDDRLISQSKGPRLVFPEVRVGSVKENSKKLSRKQATRINGDSKETKTSQAFLPIDNPDDQFPDFHASSLLVSKKPFKNRITNSNTKFQSGTEETKITSTERAISKSKSTILKKLNPESKSVIRGRKHKGYFLNYPFVPRVQHHVSNLPDYDSNFEDYNFGVEERTRGGEKKYQDSNIYYIRLPPTPYMFIPGLGYVSQPPRYSPPQMSHVRPIRPARPPTIYQPHINPFIKVPIDFVSNGKPTSVYQWQNGKPVRPENSITNLNKGPYVFNGRPASMNLLRPDGSKTVSQPIRYSDYQDNKYY